MRYILLLRGINVGGKNKVIMSDLKVDLAELGFENPVSYINSGNLFFDSQEHEEKIREILTAYFSRSYDFPIPFVLISSAILQEEMAKLPIWWQDEAAYRRDVLFYLPGANRELIEVEAESWANDRELLHFGQTAFFYSNADQADYLKSNYHKKLLKSNFYKQLTIRNGKTFQKIVELVGTIQK
ncbi:DUF1697 domain-containing protein [Streptococcus anginosus]|uniref:DUF1697 domain-containing protein n=1 Tax=Streptococcus anginosus TaxID=1328 RepID=A0AAP2P084_STRAP|nr:DUF1697 domain-containing protein [Streptococcus anginosus]MBZ2155140.1 DUF1697 domain-containing protein [Streptococcus anginosus]